MSSLTPRIIRARMPSEMTSDPDPSDLPRRTWKLWWRQLPGYWRIGAWSLLAMVLLHALLAVRIWYGLQEPADVAVFRSRNFRIMYDSDRRGGPALILFLLKMTDGLKGRSGRDVVGLASTQFGSDIDFRMIADTFPNLEWLTFSDGPVTAEGLAHLSRCRKLHSLDLSNSDVDDAALANIGQISSLSNLDLTETLVSDASLPRLQQLPKLSRVNVAYTDVSLAAIQAWRGLSPGTSLWIGTEQDQQADAVLGSIRWSDGSRSAGFSHSWSMKVSRSQGSFTNSSTGSLTRNRFWWPPQSWQQFGDGEYRLTLTLHGHESQPVTVVVTNGKPDVRLVEFVMPVTRATALEIQSGGW